MKLQLDRLENKFDKLLKNRKRKAGDGPMSPPTLSQSPSVCVDEGNLLLTDQFL